MVNGEGYGSDEELDDCEKPWMSSDGRRWLRVWSIRSRLASALLRTTPNTTVSSQCFPFAGSLGLPTSPGISLAKCGTRIVAEAPGGTCEGHHAATAAGGVS